MSHTTKRPTSNTRKPTMKIHPSVVTRSMLARRRGPAKSLRARAAQLPSAELVRSGSGTYVAVNSSRAFL